MPLFYACPHTEAQDVLTQTAVAAAVEGALVEVLGHALPSSEPLMSGASDC
jgi:hypothetical protein